MDGDIMENDKKYQKLAVEYSKLRAQASVLRKAVLEEQSRVTNLREQLRRKESTLRRTEQELDSLTFRNKQLELRVASLQEELAINEGRKPENKRESHFVVGKTPFRFNTKHSATVGEGDKSAESPVVEELQKKIVENAQLTSLVDEKDKEIMMYAEHVKSMELNLGQQIKDNSSLEKRLRQELDSLQSKNIELETKLVEAASMMGSEDGVSAADSDNIPLRGLSPDEHILQLEKEAAHWRSLYELSRLNNESVNVSNFNSPEENTIGLNTAFTVNCSCSTSAAGLNVTALSAKDTNKCSEKCTSAITKQQLFDFYSKKFEELLKESMHSKSQVKSLNIENENLQDCLENATQEIKDKEEQIQSINQALFLLEEDLTSTRTNYENQISVLTEQILNLSDQLTRYK